jgi:hypothetical protein
MYPAVKSVTPNDNHTLFLVFDNGEKGILDIKPYLDFGVFSRIQDINNFKQVKVAFDTIEWAIGVDLDPEFIYQKTQLTDSQMAA